MMRKYKQVKEKKVIYSLDEWAIIEQRAADLSMKTGTYIKRISVDGQINYYSVGDITTVLNTLRIIGKNINQIAAKANETHSVNSNAVEELRKEVDALSRTLSQLVLTERLSVA
ncbi:MAG: MobC family plasmid mobilization relaxosome protein [Oscillospiraceae bacterium]|nr:MobC family plasmid mobilization relaxosome protein [Oscillospiraceae bacterium]